jgi:CcmD family protein
VRYLLRGLLLTALALGSATHLAWGQSERPPAAQEEFVPVSELPQAEQLPAAPLVIAAYAVFWLVPFVYLWSLRRRMAAVDRELADLRERLTSARER